jgi:hypothetical protein
VRLRGCGPFCQDWPYAGGTPLSHSQMDPGRLDCTRAFFAAGRPGVDRRRPPPRVRASGRAADRARMERLDCLLARRAPRFRRYVCCFAACPFGSLHFFPLACLCFGSPCWRLRQGLRLTPLASVATLTLLRSEAKAQQHAARSFPVVRLAACPRLLRAHGQRPHA